MNLDGTIAGIPKRYAIIGGTVVFLVAIVAYSRWRKRGQQAAPSGSGSPSLSAGITAPLPGSLIGGGGFTEQPEAEGPYTSGFGEALTTAAPVAAQPHYFPYEPIYKPYTPSAATVPTRTTSKQKGGYFPAQRLTLVNL